MDYIRNNLAIIAEDLRPTYDKDFKSENYQFLYNKTISTLRLYLKKDSIEVVYAAVINVAGLISCCALIKAREELGLSKKELPIVIYAPTNEVEKLLTSEHELRMWNYIKNNMSKFVILKNSDKNIKQNHLAIYKRIVMQSDIMLGLFPMKERSSYLNTRTGFTGLQTCATVAASYGLKNGKQFRLIDTDEITLKKMVIR